MNAGSGGGDVGRRAGRGRMKGTHFLFNV